jgi:hypothetical protein
VKQRLEPGELLGRIEDDRSHAAPVHGSAGDHLPTPPLQQLVPYGRVLEKVVDDGVRRQRRGAQAAKRSQRLRLPSGDPPR